MLGAHCRARPDQAPLIEGWNIGRTIGDFQRYLRAINGLFAGPYFWQQKSVVPIERDAQKENAPFRFEAERRSGCNQMKRPARGRPFGISLLKA